MYKGTAKEGYAPPVWKRVQIQGMKESRLTIRVDEDQGLVFFEEVWTSLAIYSQLPGNSEFHVLGKICTRL